MHATTTTQLFQILNADIKENEKLREPFATRHHAGHPPNKPDHPDNHGLGVSHIGLNNDAHWKDFRERDLKAQVLFR